MSKTAKPILGEGLITYQIQVPAADVVLVRALLEAHDGVGVLFAEHGGELTLATPHSMAPYMDAFLEDLATAIPFIRR